MDRLPSPPKAPAYTPEAEGSMISTAFRRNKLLLSYGKALWEARWAARIVGILHSLSTFLAFCSLTWASVVLLGAFVSDLAFTDYSFVTALLLLEAARLASATFFSEILTRSTDPGHPSEPDDLIPLARFFSPFLQAILIAPSLICAIIRLLDTRIYSHDLIDHLQVSLRMFYALVIVNAAVSCLHLFISFMAWIRLKHPLEQSILRYYDEVLQNVLIHGVIQADNFNFFQYAFKMLGREYAKYKGWTTLVKGHRMLLTYIYAHKQGADYLQICLDSEDASVRQAAANMVGMWADETRGVGLETKDLELPPELLIKLADMVGTGEVGWAATNSFGALAKRNPEFLVQTLTSNKEPVLHRIAQLVNETSTRSLAFVRTLVLFYLRWPEWRVQGTREDTQATGSENLRKRALPEDIEEELVRKLKHLLEWSKVHRLRVLSAYLLYLLGKLDAPCHKLIRDIKPSKDTHWYRMERKMLEFFLKRMGCELTHYYPGDISDQEDIYEGPLLS